MTESQRVRVAAVLVAVAVVAGCGSSDEQPPRPRPSSSSPSASPTVSVNTPAPRASANDVAIGWLKAVHGERWNEPVDAWVERTRPWVTRRLVTQYEETAKGHDTDARRKFVKRRCVATLTEPTAVQPPEAPQRDNARWVQLTGTVETSCRRGDLTEPRLVEATVQVRQIDGQWRVAKRLN